MKTKYITEKFKYDGSQLKPLFAYMNFDLLGDSLIAWRGACQVLPEEMIDGEDLKAQAEIAGNEMLHFIAEVFDRELATGVLLQRMIATIIKDILQEKSNVLDHEPMVRDGDDLYLGDRKLSISIASKSAVSTMVHFAVNITNEGTPVKTLSLADLKVETEDFAHEVLTAVQFEWESVLAATRKVRPL